MAALLTEAIRRGNRAEMVVRGVALVVDLAMVRLAAQEPQAVTTVVLAAITAVLLPVLVAAGLALLAQMEMPQLTAAMAAQGWHLAFLVHQ